MIKSWIRGDGIQTEFYDRISLSDREHRCSLAQTQYIVDVAAESLTVGLFYSFKYTAINSVGPSDYSLVLTVPLADVPAQPTSLVLTPLSKTSITASWSASTSTGSPAGDIIGYVLYRDNGLAGDYTMIYNGTTIATVRSIVSSSLTSGYYYQFYYSAVNYVGLSPSSSIVGLYSWVEPSTMAAPIAGTITQTSVDITWVAPSDNGGWPITGYEVYVTNLDMSAYSEVHASTVENKPNLRSLTITELPSGVVGQYMRIQIHALNSAGLSSLSDILQVVVAGIPSTPTSAPTEDSTTTSKSTIGVTYLQPSDQGSSILSYDVQIDDGIGGTFTTFAGGQTNYLNLYAVATTNIIKGETYRVRYRARNVNGWSDYSDIAYILAASPPDAPPSAPLYVTSTDTSITLLLTFSISNNGAPITSHKLYMDSGSLTSLFSQVSAYNGQDSQYTVTALTKGLTYRFYLTAVNSKGESEQSNEARYTAGSPPVTPPALILTSSTKTSVTLIWTADTSSSLPVTGYAIEINDGSNSPAGRVLADQAITGVWSEVYNGRGRKDLTSVTISELNTGTLYKFRYRSFDANGGSDYSLLSTFYSCVNPSTPGTPQVSNTNLTQINVSWTAPIDIGGWAITGYKLYRDDGAGGDVNVEVGSSTLSGHPEITKVAVTELPTSPVGLSFVFKVTVFTSFATSGISSSLSSSFLFALPPATPTVAPTKGSTTSATQVEIDITTVSTTNGASILSYHVQIDDGLGGTFVDVSGALSYDLTTSRVVTSGIIVGRLYRTRYRAMNIKGYSGYSPIGYIIKLILNICIKLKIFLFK